MMALARSSRGKEEYEYGMAYFLPPSDIQTSSIENDSPKMPKVSTYAEERKVAKLLIEKGVPSRSRTRREI